MESGPPAPSPSQISTLFALQAISTLAVLGATSFWAVGVYLVFQYFFDAHLNKEERRVLKFLVCWIGLGDTVRQAFTIDAVIRGGGQLWGDQFFYIITTSNSDIMFGGAGVYFTSALVSIPSQAFFVYRMWQFSRRPWFIPTFAIPTLLFQLVFPLVLLSGKLPEQRLALFIANCVAGAVLDLLTCVGLTFLLWGRYVSWGAQKSTTSILLRLMLLSINTGLWTTLVSIYVIVGLVYTTRAHEQPPLGCYHLLSPLYFTTVLINLNSRHYIRSAANHSLSDTIRISGVHTPIPVEIPLDMLKSKGQSSASDSVTRDQSGTDKQLHSKDQESQRAGAV